MSDQSTTETIPEVETVSGRRKATESELFEFWMAVTCDCAEGRHDVCRGAGPNYYCPQSADMGDQPCACGCHREKESIMNQIEFVRENAAEGVAVARRDYAVDKPFVVHYLGLRAQPRQLKPDAERFATAAEAETFARQLVEQHGASAASVWEETRIGVEITNFDDDA